MGVLRPDNGGSWPPDEGGLPGLPPEWGTIVIPDDAAELDSDAEVFRKERRRQQRRNRLRGLFGLPPTRPGEPAPNVAVPLVIMVVAVLTTLISLFVVTWDRRPAAPVTVVTPPATNGVTAQATATTPLTELPFNDSLGRPVRLGELLPAVILLVDNCACGDLVLQTSAIVPAGVFVIAAARSAPNLAAAPTNVRAIADPQGVLRARYAPAASATAPPSDSTAPAISDSSAQASPTAPVVLFVTATGAVLHTLPSVTSIYEISAALAGFPPGSAPTSPVKPSRHGTLGR